MRARQLGIATILVLALLGATGCGDDGDADDTGTEAGGDGASDGSSLATSADAVASPCTPRSCSPAPEPLRWAPGVRDQRHYSRPPVAVDAGVRREELA
jgi:hypothetical protein